MSPQLRPAVALFELIEASCNLRSQAAIADKIGVSRSLYGMWRCGDHALPGWRIVQLVDLFKLSPTKVIAALRTQYPPSVLAEITAQYLTSKD